jgi:hypothetical protein
MLVFRRTLQRRHGPSTAAAEARSRLSLRFSSRRDSLMNEYIIGETTALSRARGMRAAAAAGGVGDDVEYSAIFSGSSSTAL